MIVIGLTGSIGMGKSTAAKMLQWLGVPVHDSDKAVHDALLPQGSAYEQVRGLFPTAVGKDGIIDRKALGAIVFKDKPALKQLEDILHPAAKSSQQKFIAGQEALGKKIVALEIPLLFETNAQDRVHSVITVTSPPDVQRARVLSRPNMSEEKFQSILTSQIPDQEKQARSNFVIDTGSGYLKTFFQLAKALRIIKRKSKA
ncbi:MAG: dephospho-CoA kinase [Micavibrio aeruginosavorus]|uniref:Dephospho-CoA kinase n=1 Tax=Micavibrio aeruginosavorus TaxID=349221 RepID=A0A2W5N6J9_9BACT|nr:MAG: dephospho-CoA kinase [Micavibrio aeruginosavorus]